MNIAQAIMHLFPQANPLMDFIVQDDSDGEGPYIAKWNLEEPEPTEEELQAAWDEFQALPVPPVPKTDRELLAEANAELARVKRGFEDLNTTVQDVISFILPE